MPDVDHALINRLLHSIRLSLSQRAGLDRGIQPRFQCSLAYRLVGRTDLLQRGFDLGLVDTEFAGEGLGQCRLTLSHIGLSRRIGSASGSVLIPDGPQRLHNLGLLDAQPVRKLTGQTAIL